MGSEISADKSACLTFSSTFTGVYTFTSYLSIKYFFHFFFDIAQVSVSLDKINVESFCSREKLVSVLKRFHVGLSCFEKVSLGIFFWYATLFSVNFVTRLIMRFDTKLTEIELRIWDLPI